MHILLNLKEYIGHIGMLHEYSFIKKLLGKIFGVLKALVEN